MKQRLTKKFVSMFLAVMMIVTSMPFAAVTASAATQSGSWRQVYYDNCNDYDGRVYDTSSNSGAFSSQALDIAGGVDAKKTYAGTGEECNNYKIEFYYNPKTVGISESIIDIGGTSTGTDKQYFIVNEDGSLYYCWQDSTGSSFIDINGTKNVFGGKLVANSWHHIVIEIQYVYENGKAYDIVTFTVNGEVTSTFDTKDRNFSGTATGTCDGNLIQGRTISDYLSKGTTVLYGKTSHWSPASNGAIDSFRIYSQGNPKYLLAYFTGDTVNEQKIRFAVSSDGTDFTNINNNTPTIIQTLGTGCCRDPYISLGHDGYYYAMATDMDASGKTWWGNQSGIMVWKSEDLINWTNETRIEMNDVMKKRDGGNYSSDCTWAPQFIWNEDLGKYIVYFALACTAYIDDFGVTENVQIMVYCEADDLLDQDTWTAPQFLYRANQPFTDSKGIYHAYGGAIDGDIIEENGKYYLFYKDEASGTICVTVSDNMLGPYSNENYIVLDSNDSSVGLLEGSQIYKNNNDEYIFIADRYAKGTYFIMYNFGKSLEAFLGDISSKSTKDISATLVNSNIANLSTRHGSVIRISDEQWRAIKKANYNSFSMSDTQGEGVDLTADLISRYYVNDTVTDETGNGYNLTSTNVAWTNKAVDGLYGAATFDGTENSYSVQSSFSTMMSGKSGYTISFMGYKEDVTRNQYARFVETSNKAPHTYTWSGGANKCTLTDLYGDGRYESMYKDWNVRTTNSFASPISNSWHIYTMTFDVNSNTVKVYMDGKLVLTDTSSDVIHSEMFSSFSYLNIGTTCYNIDGEQNYSLKGMIRDFRVYGRAITDEEAARLPRQYYLDTEAEILQVGADYENKMKSLDSSKYYTGLSEAYNAYVEYNKAMDSYLYGGRTDVDITDYMNALNSATKNIKEITYSLPFDMTIYNNDMVGSNSKDANPTNPYYANYDGDINKYVDDSSHGWNDYYKNVIYGEKSSSKQRGYYDNSGWGVDTAIYYPEVTLLYDGVTKPSTTVMCHIRKYSSSKNRYFFGNVLTNGDGLVLGRGYWNGTDGSRNFRWLYGQDKSNDRGRFGTTYGDNTYGLNDLANNKSKYYYLANTLVYEGSFDSDIYLKEIKPTFTIYYDSSNSHSYSAQVHTMNCTETPIRIINYKAYIDAFDKFKGNYNSMMSSIDVTNYKQGGLENFFNATSAFNFDVASYFTSGNNYSDCVKDLTTAVNNLESFDMNKVLVDKTEYQGLRDVLSGITQKADGTYRDVVKQYNAGNTGYTADSWTAFSDAFGLVQSTMNVLDLGYTMDTSYPYAQNLIDAYDGLKLDFTPVEAAELKLLIDDVSSTVLSNEYRDYFTPETLSPLESVVNAAKSKVWAKGEYGFDSSLIEYTEDNQNYVNNAITEINALVPQLRITPDKQLLVNGGIYSLNSAIALNDSISAADYSNYSQFGDALDVAQQYRESLATTQYTDIVTQAQEYKENIELLVSSYNSLTYAFTKLRNGTVASTGNNVALSTLRRADRGEQYIDFSYTPNAIIFRTTKDAVAFNYGKANITFATTYENRVNNAIDSISINATADALGNNGDKLQINSRSYNSTPAPLNDTEKVNYAGCLTNGAFELKNIRYTGKSSSNNPEQILTLSDGTKITDETTAKNMDLTSILGTTDGAEANPIKGGVFVRDNGSAAGEVYLSSDLTVNIPAAASVSNYTADTVPTKSSYSASGYFGTIVSWNLTYAGGNYSGYSWMTSKQNNETINFSADVIDISNLIGLVQEVGELQKVRDDYTTSSWTVFETALNEAQADMNYTTMSADEILSACQNRYTNLWNAKQKLRLRSDISAYLSAKEKALISISNTQKYTPESINALKLILENNVVTDENTQDEVNTATNNIIAADQLKTVNSNGVLVLNKYKVTFTYFDTEGQQITKIDDNEYEYGASVDLTVPDEAGQVYKWNKNIKSADSKIAGSTNRITHIVTDNVTITAYTVQHQTSGTQYCVTVYNRINKVIGYFYVDKNSTVSIDGPTISVGDNRLTVEKTPYYQITGFKCNGQEISTDFTVTSDVKIYPIYSAQNEIGITLNNNSGNAQITFDDGTKETKKVCWDQKVTVQADSEVIWYVDDVAVAKGNKYTFRATKSITIKAVADATETGSSIITYANFDSENRKARIAVSSYSSGEKVIKEQGLIILTSTSASELSYDDIKNNGKKYKATNTTSEGNQFSFTLNVSQSSSIKTFGIISYVIYKDDETTTYYSTECKNINVI